MATTYVMPRMMNDPMAAVHPRREQRGGNPVLNLRWDGRVGFLSGSLESEPSLPEHYYKSYDMVHMAHQLTSGMSPLLLLAGNATTAAAGAAGAAGAALGQQHWPDLQFGWRMAVATLFAMVGAALGSVGGLGGGGIFVPTLMLILGFDAKTAPALSKCMIMAQSASTFAFNIQLRRPSSDEPLINYDLGLLFQPMLLLGISLGVIFNVVFPDWLITLLLILISTAVASRTCWRGVDAWRTESMLKARLLEAEEEASAPESALNVAVSLRSNVKWKDVSMMLVVWCIMLLLQLLKSDSAKCSGAYWTYNFLQVPVAFGATALQACRLHKRTLDEQQQPFIESQLDLVELQQHRKSSSSMLILYSLCGILAGVVGGLLGQGGGAIIGPAMLEFGASPQEASATAVFVMVFSSSMSVVEYYLLDRFPVPHAIYFGAVCVVAAFCGQKCIHWLVQLLGRTSIIVFVLVFIVLTGGVSLGTVGVFDAIERVRRGEYMGFQSLCE